jgi:hypothetical protein
MKIPIRGHAMNEADGNNCEEGGGYPAARMAPRNDVIEYDVLAGGNVADN